MSATDPLLVDRFDVAMEPAIEDEPILTIGAIDENGHPVALLLDPETRAKVGGWLLPHLADEAEKLRAALDEMTHCRDNALRSLHRDDVETDIDLEETIATPFYGPGWDWDEADLMTVVREAVNAIRPAFGKLTEERDTLRTRLAELEPYAPTGYDPVEDIEYKVAGDWGVDGADTAEAAIAFVRKALQAHPHCGAYAQQRVTRRWDDDSEWYGPWTDLPIPPPRQQEDPHDSFLHQRFETCRDLPTVT